MSIATEITRLQTAKSDIKTAIEGKGVPVPSSAKLDTYDDYINAIPTGGGTTEADDNDVILIDYDGTRLYSYTKAEFLALSALPANPTHQGLTAQGWNWTLADAKAYVTTYGGLIIGQNYVTDDGNTRIYIRLTDANHLSPTINSSGTIDWGDGSAAETGSGDRTHTYATTGDYVIKVSGGLPCLPITGTDAAYYMDSVYKWETGSGVTSYLTYQFRFFRSLESVTIPTSLTSLVGGGTFYGCVSLKGVVLPPSIGSLGNFCFWYATNARYVSLNKGVTFGSSSSFQYSGILKVYLPDSVTSLQVNCFNNCHRLEKVCIPSGVTSLPNGCFQSAGALTEVLGASGVTGLVDYAFSDTKALAIYTLPSSVTTINQRIMQGSGIYELTIPAGVTSIGNYAFYSCDFLRIVHAKPITPPSAGSGIFQTSANLDKIYVPAGSLSAYQTASGWSGYASKMVEE